VLDLDYGQYRLNGDLVCPWPSGPAGNAAVAITGEGVHFNLQGYTITRDDAFGRFVRRGIEVSGANAHIHNGSIVDINCPAVPWPDNAVCAGIHLMEAPGTRINGMSLHNNTVGIILLGGDNADGARIHGNDITGNLRQGIGLFGEAEGAKITDNDLSDTGGFTGPGGTPRGGHGYIGSSDGVSLIGNVANNNARNGIFLWGRADNPPAERNTVRDNETLDNGRHGIFVWALEEAYRPRDNLIQSNTSFGHTTPPYEDLTEGFGDPNAAVDCVNTWKDNDFDLAEPADCIE
jgi:parallel beta-helix repeat protein